MDGLGGCTEDMLTGRGRKSSGAANNINIAGCQGPGVVHAARVNVIRSTSDKPKWVQSVKKSTIARGGTSTRSTVVGQRHVQTKLGESSLLLLCTEQVKNGTSWIKSLYMIIKLRKSFLMYQV